MDSVINNLKKRWQRILSRRSSLDKDEAQRMRLAVSAFRKDFDFEG